MSEATYSNRPKSEPTHTHSSPGPNEKHSHHQSLDPEELLSVFSDEYARDILRTISEDPLPAREIATRLDISRPTVYRRLNRLDDLGLIETSMAYDSDGHHRKEFNAAVEQFMISFDSGELLVDRLRT